MKESIAGRRDLSDTLDKYLSWLCDSTETKSATEELKVAMASGDRTKAALAADKLRQPAKEIAELAKRIDQIDPHVLDPAEAKDLRKLGPIRLVEDALHHGKLRERRMLLQAMEAETNRWLAKVAVVAAVIALFIPFLERLLKWWLG